MKDLMDLYGMAERDGVTVDCFELNSRDALSVMDENGECFIAIDPFRLKSSIDEKEKLAHELGHCETGSFYNAYSTLDIREKHENRATRWAIRQLVSRDDLERAFRDGCRTRFDLSEWFGVSEQLMQEALDYYSEVF